MSVIVISVQALTAPDKDARRFTRWKGGRKTLVSLVSFIPLAVLRYQATHRTVHDKIHRRYTFDAYSQKL